MKAINLLNKSCLAASETIETLAIIKSMDKSELLTLYLQDDSGIKQSILHIAAKNGHIYFVRYLHEVKGLSINLQNTYNATPLHIAAEYDQIDVVKYLVKKGTNPNLLDKSNRSPLQIATFSGFLDIAIFLWPYTSFKMKDDLLSINFKAKSSKSSRLEPEVLGIMRWQENEFYNKWLSLQFELDQLTKLNFHEVLMSLKQKNISADRAREFILSFGLTLIAQNKAEYTLIKPEEIYLLNSQRCKQDKKRKAEEVGIDESPDNTKRQKIKE
ncbi:MAG: ankyrin repeat domain-containing protein [Alphaproteobacteria bacterium]|nr:ankyrin repeat domain-containing protein [Alphaproteobacteria bacterium]